MLGKPFIASTQEHSVYVKPSLVSTQVYNVLVR